MMNASEEAALSTSEYWDKRYESSGHEWFRSYDSLVPFFKKHLFDTLSPETNPRILHLGSGDSTIPYDLAVQGYKDQLCVDFSTKVIDIMSDKPSQNDAVKWQWADVRDMPDVADSSFDLAFDKGTMDAMIHGSPWDPPEMVKDNTSRYLREVFRILKDTGVFLYVTFRQPHFIRPLLNNAGIWNVEMEVLSDGASSFEYYGWILTKPKTSD